jgi:hypothetical protein
LAKLGTFTRTSPSGRADTACQPAPLAIVLSIAALAIAWIKFGSSGGTAVKNNFDPDWNCVNPDEGDSVCIKKVKPDQEAH